jgi:hypothetical protein
MPHYQHWVGRGDCVLHRLTNVETSKGKIEPDTVKRHRHFDMSNNVATTLDLEEPANGSNLYRDDYADIGGFS